jgi:hypothetical protein
VRRRDWVDAALVAGLAVLVAVYGQPQPFAIIAAGVGGLSAVVFVVRRYDKPR